MSGDRPQWLRGHVTGRDVATLVWRAVVVTAVVEVASGLLGARIPLPVVWLLAVALLASVRVAAAAQPPPLGPPLPHARAEPAQVDRPFRDVGRMADRLAWGRLDMDRFESTVRPVLVRLADERLSGRHGISRASHPERARQLLGDDLWQLATGPSMASKAAGPTPAQVGRLVEQLERI
ncbi:MAG: hypothetical protein M3O55_00475 [Actinomycetota bacterium]|nr:hypothetical protein [Actinomycetota bacterium]